MTECRGQGNGIATKAPKVGTWGALWGALYKNEMVKRVRWAQANARHL